MSLFDDACVLNMKNTTPRTRVRRPLSVSRERRAPSLSGDLATRFGKSLRPRTRFGAHLSLSLSLSRRRISPRVLTKHEFIVEVSWKSAASAGIYYRHKHSPVSRFVLRTFGARLEYIPLRRRKASSMPSAAASRRGASASVARPVKAYRQRVIFQRNFNGISTEYLLRGRSREFTQSLLEVWQRSRVF